MKEFQKIYFREEIESRTFDFRYSLAYEIALITIKKLIDDDLKITIPSTNPYLIYLKNEFSELYLYQQEYIDEIIEALKYRKDFVDHYFEEDLLFVVGTVCGTFPFKEYLDETHFKYSRNAFIENPNPDFEDKFEEYCYSLAMASSDLDKILKLKLMLKKKLNLDNYSYSIKPYETEIEQKFFKKILNCLSRDYHLIAQVCLASIIDKKNTDGSNVDYRSELFKIIDFGIFDDNYGIKLLVEIDDKTHQREDRKSRDEYVNLILKKVNIPLISFKPRDIDNTDKIIEQLGEFVKPEFRKK